MTQPRILIVEDEAIVAMDIEDRLTTMGYIPAGRAANGPDAIALTAEHHPDLVLMDIRLQGEMDGITTAETIYHQYRVPVIFLTAYSEEQTLERAKEAGPFGYILKPFDDRILRSTVEIALYKHRAEQEILRANRLYTVLSQVNQAIVRAPSREALLAAVCRIMVEQGRLDQAWIGWIDADGSRLRRQASFGMETALPAEIPLTGPHLPEGCWNPAQAVRDDRPCICTGCEAEGCANERPGKAFRFRSCAAFPLRGAGAVQGVLALRTGEPAFFQDRETALFDEVAADLSFALEKLESDLQRRRYAELIRHQEMLLREAGTLAHVGGWDFDPDTFEGNWTEETARIHDLPPDSPPNAALGMSFYHGESRRRIEAAVKEAVETGRPYDLELEMISARGIRKWVRTICHPVVRGGKVIRVRGAIQDITEVRETQGRLMKLAEAVQQASEGIVITEPDGRVTYANPAFERITGYGENDLSGRPLPMTESDRQDAALRNAVRETLRAGNRWRGRITDNRKGGGVYTAECSIAPVRKPGGMIANFVWIFRDMTREIELERRINQSQKMEALGTLAGGIAHDFNNILVPILGYSEMLMEEIPRSGGRFEAVQEIHHAAERARDLVRQILAFSRRSNTRRQPVLIQPIVKEALKLVRATIPTNIGITFDISAACGHVVVDPTQLHQILMNLVTNAYHAVEEVDGGGITVLLKEMAWHAVRHPDLDLKPGPYACLTVRDSGGGIAPDQLEKVFEPYFTTKGQGKGTGLGLSVVHGIVQECGGAIRIDSAVGKGTAVQVFLPVVPHAETRSREPEKPVRQRGSERILLVDDEAPVAQMMQRMLERLGYRVTACTDSRDALSAFHADPFAFDLVITDMAMPHQTGDRLAREMMAARPDIPIIMTTGYSEKIDARQARELGIRGFFAKPVRQKELVAQVRKILDGTAADT